MSDDLWVAEHTEVLEGWCTQMGHGSSVLIYTLPLHLFIWKFICIIYNKLIQCFPEFYGSF